MKIANFGLISMARSRVPFLAPPPWESHEHPVDHLPPPHDERRLNELGMPRRER